MRRTFSDDVALNIEPLLKTVKPGSHMPPTYVRLAALYSSVDVIFRPSCIAEVAQMYLGHVPGKFQIAP